MNKLNLLVIVTMLSMVFALAVSASPSQTIQLPAADTTIAGTINLSAEINGTAYNMTSSPQAGNVTNVTWYAWDEDGNETLLYNNGSNIRNFTLTNWTGQVDSAILNDFTSPYTIGIRVWNGTLQANATNNTGITVDNTVPTFTLITTAGTEFDDVTNVITGDARNADGNCIWVFNGNQIVGSAIATSTGRCTLTLSEDVPPDGDYQVQLKASDGVNATQSNPVNYNVNFNKRGNKQSVPTGTAAGEVVKKLTNEKATVILLVIAGAFLLLRKKGGKR